MIKLVLVRHGQSVWNLENKFTGWNYQARVLKKLKKLEEY